MGDTGLPPVPIPNESTSIRSLTALPPVPAPQQALARMIIVDELPFSHLEGEGFRYYTSCLQPKFPIPGRLTVARDCWKLYLNEKVKLKSVFSQPNQNVCLTTDCWSSVQNLNYLCLTAHYIDANWKLMEDWNSHPLRGEFLQVRCCAHILNLVVNDGLREMHESILKIRNAVRHVRASPGRSESALKFQKAFKHLGERDSEYAMMAGGIPRSEDWENAKHFVKFLKIFYEVTNKVSGSTFVTSSQHFNDFCKILSTLKHWMGSLDTILSSMAKKMKSKYDKYWGNIKNTNMMIFIAVVLDPRYKLQLIKWSFEKLYEKEDAEFLTSKVKETLFRVFDSYRLFGDNYQRSSRQDPPEISTQELEAHETSFAMEFEKEMQFNESANKNEVELYLMEALEKSGVQFDILNWWKVNSTKFPILGLIARDVLAMPVSTVASESAFSTGGRVLNNYRSSLTPMTAEALICTQNWLRNSPKLVLEELIEELEKLELGMVKFLLIIFFILI
ncbi:hypothetical protein Ahy_A05g023909 isoform B [Arachis hypogaea]|uniref:HAT C-terminal dimerisation domain-containing protein n=1 Tax=Arachis hypogaea TaxID=3818 RepID=A0A445D4W0_ARAHY|nr:hypothetical protein Ahy_A05g023909 isoform B [Arachis hypogaea]